MRKKSQQRLKPASETQKVVNKEEDDKTSSEPVCDDKPDILATVETIKHPLEHAWSIWLQDVDVKKSWEENLVELTTFDTVEDYWCLYHHMKLPSELLFGQDYGIFKKGIRPMWEDKANARGGRLLIMVDRRVNNHLDRLWLDTVLLMIGENFEDNDMINGVVVNIRTKNKIGIWTKDCTNVQSIIRMESMLKNVLGNIYKYEYLPHDQSQQAKKYQPRFK